MKMSCYPVVCHTLKFSARSSAAESCQRLHVNGNLHSEMLGDAKVMGVQIRASVWILCLLQQET